MYRKALPTIGQSRKKRYPRETVQAVSAAAYKPMSAQTAAAHLKHARSSWHWLVKKHGAAGDPFEGLAIAVEDADRTHNRRPFIGVRLQLTANFKVARHVNSGRRRFMITTRRDSSWQPARRLQTHFD